MKRFKYIPFSEIKGRSITLPFVGEGTLEKESSLIVGYCHYPWHRGFLTTRSLKEHKCIQKKCASLEKFKDYPYWKCLEGDKKKKIQVKQQLKQKLKDEQILETAIEKAQRANTAENLSDMMLDAQIFCMQLGLTILITKVWQFDSLKKLNIVNYVSNKDYDDHSLYDELAVLLNNKYSEEFLLRHIRLPNGKFALKDD